MAKKPLRDITPKGDTKLLNKDLKGVKSSTTDSPDLDNLLMDPDNMKGTKDFVKKYMKTQTHDDRVGNKSDGAPYASKGKAANYPKADADMYEAADCSCDDDKHSCAVHGKGNKKLLLGDKKEVKEHSELSGLDAMPGAAPEGMVRHAENTWKNAEQYFDKAPTQLTGQGKPFLSKMGDAVKESIREIQKEAVNNLYEKLTDSAKSNIRTALTPKMKQSSKPVKALIKIAKTNKDNIKEDAPPSKSSEEWIKKNKSRFTKEYGKDKGERVLYGKAWNDYKEKH